jgi:xanthine/uracil/vitamin C permease (AzgA family)
MRAFMSTRPKRTDMREHMLLFCLLGLVLTATIMLVAARGAVTWALALIE